LATLLNYHTWILPICNLGMSNLVVWAKFTKDGKRIVAGCSDNSAHIWNSDNGQPISTPLMHKTAVNSVELSPDGNWIVTASDDTTAQIWDARTGRALTPSLNHMGPVRSAEFSPDGTRVVTASDDKTAQIWDARSGEKLSEPLRHDSKVSFAHFSNDANVIYTASGIGDTFARPSVHMWDAQTAKELPWQAPTNHGGFAGSSDDSGRFVADRESFFDRLRHSSLAFSEGVDLNGWADRFSTEVMNRKVKPKERDLPVERSTSELLDKTAFSSDGRRIVTVTKNGAARLWDAQSGQALSQPLSDGAWRAIFSPDGKQILTVYGNTVFLWDAQDSKLLGKPLSHSGAISAAQFSPDGTRVVTASDDGTARVWDVLSHQAVTGPCKHRAGIRFVQFSPDGNWIATASAENTAIIWDAQNGKPLIEPLKHSGGVNSVDFSPDSSQIVTSSDDFTARVWGTKNGQPVGEPLRHNGKVSSVRFSPDGKKIVTASDDGTARVWDAKNGQALIKPLRHDSKVNSAHFSPDDRGIIVTASDDGTARIWDAKNGGLLTADLRHPSSVRSAQFSPDGKRIVTLDIHGVVRVWDVQSGAALSEPFTLQNSEAPIAFAAEFSPDGRRIVVAYSDAARVWDIAPATSSEPDWFRRLVEMISGAHLNSYEFLEKPRDDICEEIEKIRQELKQMPSDDWVSWGQWLLGDRGKRSVSPFSRMMVPEFIDAHIKAGTMASFNEAEQAAAGNPELLEKISAARKILVCFYQAGYFRKNPNDGSPYWKNESPDFQELKRDNKVILLKDSVRNSLIEFPVNGGMSKISTDDGRTWDELFWIRK
jgi:WD40 repeat protein